MSKPDSATASPPLIYLAGPMVFDRDPVAIFDRMKTLCLGFGVAGVAPLDNQIGLRRPSAGKGPAGTHRQRRHRADGQAGRGGVLPRQFPPRAGDGCRHRVRGWLYESTGQADRRLDPRYTARIHIRVADFFRTTFGEGADGDRGGCRRGDLGTVAGCGWRPGAFGRLRAERHGPCRDRTGRRRGRGRWGLGTRVQPGRCVCRGTPSRGPATGSPIGRRSYGASMVAGRNVPGA